MSRNGIIIVIIALLLFAIGIVVYRNTNFVSVNQNKSPSPTPNEQNGDRSTPTPTPRDSANAPENWRTFENNNFSIKYPPDMQVRQNQNGSVAFIKLGPTQTSGTEIFDGISMTIDSGNILSGQNFRQFVESERQQMIDEPANQNVGQLNQTTVAREEGYTFTSTGLGEFTHIFLPKGESQYVYIYMLVEDPENQGFQKTVDQMLSTLKF